MGETAAQIKARLRKQFNLTEEDIDRVRPLDERGADMYREPTEEELAEELKGPAKSVADKAERTGRKVKARNDYMREKINQLLGR